jgi:outer membrane protein, heavy metal efflux system
VNRLILRTIFTVSLLATVAIRGWSQDRAGNLDDLIQQALRENPQILAAQKRYEAARQRPAQASALDETMLSLGYASAGNPLPLAGLGKEPTANIGFMVTQDIPFPGKRQLRGDIAYKEAEAEFERYEAVRRDVVSRVKQAYYRLVYARSVEELLLKNRELLSQLLKVTEIRYSVGNAAQQDVFKAQTELSLLQTRLLQVEREQRIREVEIGTLLNRTGGFSLAVIPSEPPPSMTLALDDLIAATQETSPMIRADQKMIERAELAMNLARKDFYPDYAMSGGYFYQGSMPAMYQFRLDLKLPTSFFRKQRAGLAEQNAMLAEARRNYEATGRSLYLSISDDYLMAQTSIRLMKLYEETLTPQATLALDSSMPGYETGKIEFLSVLTNFTARLEVQMSYFEEMMNARIALARLEAMTGVSLLALGGVK